MILHGFLMLHITQLFQVFILFTKVFDLSKFIV